MSLLLLLIASSVACAWPCLLPGCQPLVLSDDSSALDSGACYFVASSQPTSTPSLSLLPDPFNSSTPRTWASAAAPEQLPVLDLCNVVQNIWLLQGP